MFPMRTFLRVTWRSPTSYVCRMHGDTGGPGPDVSTANTHSYSVLTLFHCVVGRHGHRWTSALRHSRRPSRILMTSITAPHLNDRVIGKLEGRLAPSIGQAIKTDYTLSLRCLTD